MPKILFGLYSFAWKAYQMIKIAVGYGIYSRIRLKFSRAAIYIYDYSGIGDVYVFCMYIKANYNMIQNGNFVIALNKKALCTIFKLFDLKNCLLITGNQAKTLTLLSLASPSGTRIRNITPFPRFNHTDISFRFGGIFLTMAEIYKYQMFKLPETAPFCYPQLKPENHTIEQFFAENRLTPGKTAILSPFAKTIAGFSDGFWQKLAVELYRKGFVVCTNAMGSEKPIEGTKGVSFDFYSAEEVLKRSGLFIAIRSGLCDVVCNADCKKIILYPVYRIFNSSMYDFCSFEKMGIGRNIVEIQESHENEDILLERVLNHINAWHMLENE
jgi:hypothetical protein